jgi:hypothetical protein
MSNRFIVVVSLLILLCWLVLPTIAFADIACPACGHENPETARFCMNCGERLVKTGPSITLCPACGQESPEGADYCIHCGARLVAAEILFSDEGSAPADDLGYVVHLNPGASAQTDRIDGDNGVRVLRKTGPKSMYIERTIPTGIHGLRFQARVRSDFTWDTESSMAPGYPYATIEIVFSPSSGKSLGTYILYAYKKHPFENSLLAGTPKSLDRIYSTQRDLGYRRVSESKWNEFDIDLEQLLRENFPSASPDDVRSISLVFSLNNWPPQPLEQCNGETRIDYVRVLRQ